MDNIGNLMHKQFPEPPRQPKKALSRFDMMVRWPEPTNRRINPFTYQGDYFEKDTDKQLWSLVRYFLKSHNDWLFCQIRDNSKPEDDPERIVFWFNKKQNRIIVNRLQDYPDMLKSHPVPEWLK